MKKFEFRLQKLLEIRQDREDEQKIVLARASGAYQREVNRKNSILDHVEEYRQRIKTKPSLQELRDFDLLQQDSDRAIHEIDKEIEKKRKVMETEMKKYVKLKQERMAVDTLRKKAWEEYQAEVKKEEQRELDEIGKNIYLRNKEIS